MRSTLYAVFLFLCAASIAPPKLLAQVIPTVPSAGSEDMKSDKFERQIFRSPSRLGDFSLAIPRRALIKSYPNFGSTYEEGYPRLAHVVSESDMQITLIAVTTPELSHLHYWLDGVFSSKGYVAPSTYDRVALNDGLRGVAADGGAINHPDRFRPNARAAAAAFRNADTVVLVIVEWTGESQGLTAVAEQALSSLRFEKPKMHDYAVETHLASKWRRSMTFTTSANWRPATFGDAATPTMTFEHGPVENNDAGMRVTIRAPGPLDHHARATKFIDVVRRSLETFPEPAREIFTNGAEFHGIGVDIKLFKFESTTRSGHNVVFFAAYLVRPDVEVFFLVFAPDIAKPTSFLAIPAYAAAMTSFEVAIKTADVSLGPPAR